MLHESVAEFDSNMAQAPVEDGTQDVENIKTELAKAPQDYCPGFSRKASSYISDDHEYSSRIS